MKKVISKIINTSLKPIGLRLCTMDRFNQINADINLQYMKLIEEINGCFSEKIFGELPHCDNRIELMAKLIGTNVSEAIYIVAFLHKSLELAGDVCEFGVAQGATSALLANELRTTEKALWLYDSFEGLPGPSKKDLLINDILNLGQIEKYEGTMSCSADMVRQRLENISFPLSRVKIVRGFVEEVIKNEDLPDKICFAYVDFDFYKPTLITLKALHKRLSIGGAVVIDDYGFFSSGVKTAVAEFMIEHESHYEIHLPYKFAGHFCILERKV